MHEAERELDRFAAIPPVSPEYGLIRTHLDWMLVAARAAPLVAYHPACASVPQPGEMVPLDELGANLG